MRSDPIYGSAFVPKPKKNDFPKDYYVPDFGLDSDIKGTMQSMAQSEQTVGKWTPKLSEDGEYIVP